MGWEYAFQVLHASAHGRPLTKWRAVFIVDGYDNDSPGKFQGPAGFNEMMNRLHKDNIHPEISVYCVGNDACMGDENGLHHFRDLVLHSGGVYSALLDGASVEEELQLIDAFADRFTAPRERRAEIEQESKREWLRLVDAGSPISNKDQEYTKEL